MSESTYIRNKETVWRTLGNKCARCGCDTKLQLDHKDPLTKEFEVTPRLGGKLGPLWEEIHKCQLLCEPCHREKNKEDQESIQKKRKEFIHVSSRFDPILQETMCDISVDLYKRDGKAYMKFVEHLSKKTGDSVQDIIIRLHEECDTYNQYYMFCEWDNLEWKNRPTKEHEKKFKSAVKRKMKDIKKEQPKFYKWLESLRERGQWLGEDDLSNQIPFSREVDQMIEKLEDQPEEWFERGAHFYDL